MGNLSLPATPFTTGTLFGALLLCAGLGIGLWLGRRRASPQESTSLNDYYMRNALRNLFKWTDGFAHDVSHYRQVVDTASEQFNAIQKEGDQTDRSPVVGMLSQIVQANDELQRRLERAETTLQDQSEEIKGYMSEARTDALTGLPNRRAFDDELNRRVAEVRRNGSTASVLLVDIDHFKRFNDQYGHLAGDAVLEQVARVLRDTMRETDLVARIGGEEFAVILPGIGDSKACQAAERARHAVDQARFRYEGVALRVTVSCGVAQAVAEENMTSLVKRADQAMYASKAAGRNSAHFHDGLVCLPINAPSSTDGRQNAADCQPQGENFRQVCNQLRQRLMVVVSEEAGV